MDNFLMHIGTPHQGPIPHSGRYEYGSGENAYQRHQDLYSTYKREMAKGTPKKDIAIMLGFVKRYGDKVEGDVKQLDAQYSMATRQIKAYQTAEIKRLHDEEGMGWTEIGNKLGLADTTVISRYRSKNEILSRSVTAENALKDYVDKYKYVDVSAGANLSFGISETGFEKIVSRLEVQGYEKHFIKIDQMGTNNKTTVAVLCPPGTDYSELNDHRYDIRGIDALGRIIDTSGEFQKLGIEKAPSVDSSRVMVKYAEEGGKDRDGLIEIRRGLDDLSLGGSLYAQVRIAVDDSHYLKGMAIYADDLPDGIDIRFNTNKHVGTPMLGADKDNSVLKPLKKDLDGNVDWDNPFGATVTQVKYTDKNGDTVISPIHIVNKEGDWEDWGKNLSSQFLSKQPPAVAEQQLKLNILDKREEFDTIKSITNPVVKQELLEAFASKCDSMAVDLKAHSFPGQQTHVILPFTSIPDGKCYATNYQDGTQVVLIRHPHEGIMQIPKLTVDNSNAEARKAIGNARDAIGINAKAAEQLSGADFDGDTTIVIPITERNKVQVAKAQKELIEFDAKEVYPGYEGMKRMTPHQKGIEMGVISNLITDMTLKGAPMSDIVRATKYSMTVIDAEKHGLDYKRAAKELRIDELKNEWQYNSDGTHGASTIISKAKSEERVGERKDYNLTRRTDKPSIDPVTGEKIYEYTNKENQKVKLKSSIRQEDGSVIFVDRIQTDRGTGQHYYISTDASGAKKKNYFDDSQYTKGKEVFVNLDKKTGKYYYISEDPSTKKKVRTYVTEENTSGDIKNQVRTTKSTKMAEATDAYKLTSGGSKENPGTRIEAIYAEYANTMKSYANQARLEWLNTPNLKMNKEAKAQYKDEVASLNAKLKVALSKAPKERQAQLLANHVIAVKKEEHPELTDDKEHLSKYKAQAINSARKKLGIEKGDYEINITDREWDAIQSGAISHSKAKEIFAHTDLDKIKERATPRRQSNITPSMEALAKSLSNRGFTTAEIADRLGISPSSVSGIVKPKKGGK